jgi:agmatine deiminase
MRKDAIKWINKNIVFGFIVLFIVVCLSALLPNIPQSAHSLVTSFPYNDSSYFVDFRSDVSSSSPSGYIHRGDWEQPDVLLVVDNHEWMDSLRKIVTASHDDGIPVYILADQDEVSEEARTAWELETDEGRVLHFSHDSPWIRDYGPIQLKSAESKIQWLDFGYAWDRPNDDTVPRKLAGYIGIPIKSGKYYLEGGAIISNGEGLCAITDRSLIEASVDRESPAQLEAFRQLLGCRALAILPGLTGERTGHADMIAQFLSRDTVAVSVMDPEVSYLNAAELNEAAESMLSSAISIGQKLRIIRLPMHVEGENYYSYVNGTRLKDTYLVPSFESVPAEVEKMAYRLMRSMLHDVRVVPIPADSMVESGGAVHCITLGLSFPRSVDTDQYWDQKDKTYALQAFLTLIRKKVFHSEFRSIHEGQKIS